MEWKHKIFDRICIEVFIPGSAAENAKSWVAQRTTHGWWLGRPSQFWVVLQSINCSEHEINENYQKQAIGIRVLLRRKYKWNHDISECYVQFHPEIFSAIPKEFIGRQTDHWWWDLGSPGGFMGRIWPPGDHISAALTRSYLKIIRIALNIDFGTKRASCHYLNQWWPSLHQQIGSSLV